MESSTYIKNLKYLFGFFCNLEQQAQEWLYSNSDFSLSYDSIYATFMDNLGGAFILKDRWDWVETVNYSELLKKSLKEFTVSYEYFYQEETFPFNSSYEYHKLILEDTRWKNLSQLACKIRKDLDTEIYEY